MVCAGIMECYSLLINSVYINKDGWDASTGEVLYIMQVIN